MKTCSKCGEEKDLESFYKKKGCKDGRCSECKKCTSIRNKNYWVRKKDILSVKGKKYREKNKTVIKKRKSKYYKKNIELFKKRNAEYCLKNKEKISEYNKEYRKKNLSKLRRHENKESKKNTDELKDKYVRQILIRLGFNSLDITKEIIETKREQLKLHRLTKNQ